MTLDAKALEAAVEAAAIKGLGWSDLPNTVALARTQQSDPRTNQRWLDACNSARAALSSQHAEAIPVAEPKALELVDAITPGNFQHFREVGDLTGWCERMRRDLRAALSSPVPAYAEPGIKADDETYEIGKRDGYAEAVQQIDVLTGGDGEYRYCTGRDPDRHTPDPEAMIRRIVARFAAGAKP